MDLGNQLQLGICSEVIFVQVSRFLLQLQGFTQSLGDDCSFLFKKKKNIVGGHIISEFFECFSLTI